MQKTNLTVLNLPATYFQRNRSNHQQVETLASALKTLRPYLYIRGSYMYTPFEKVGLNTSPWRFR